jgi:putative restriction endonuclease
MDLGLWVAVTDNDWYTFLSRRQEPEVNFWRPSGKAFHALQPGELFLFKLHYPLNWIVGGGVFLKATNLSVRAAWDFFGYANGAPDYETFLTLLQSRNRHLGDVIHCIVLEEVFYFPREAWIPVPRDWSPSIQQGKKYQASEGEGRILWQELQERLSHEARWLQGARALPALVEGQGAPTARYGRPRLVVPRQGQGGFRLLVTQAYAGRCVATGEKVLPVLEAAHIRPFSHGGEHAVENGLLLRSDLHRLFDAGYLTVNPEDRRFVVSSRLYEEFHNGEMYRKLHGRPLPPPQAPYPAPSLENLRYHAEHIFLSA